MHDKPKRKKFRQEDVIASYIHRPLALEIVRLLWNTNITANQITLFRVVLNIISLIFFAQGTLFGFVSGFIFFQIQEVLDTVDGMYSRYKKQTSKIGAYLEYLFDDLFSTANGLFGLSIAYGAYSATENFIYIWLFIAITIGHSLSMAYVIHFEKEKICQEQSLHNIDHDNEAYPALFGVGLKRGIRNFIFTVVVWKNELLLWGALFFFWGKSHGVDLIFWALFAHVVIFNIFWIRRAYSGYRKAMEMDKIKNA
jgi:phosphatidylglycerophosphate synthase